MTALPVLNMFKPSQPYEPVGAEDSHAELAAWREDPETTVEARNHQINIHRRPGFYKKGLLGSIAINAILMIVCAWMYMKLTMLVKSAASTLDVGTLLIQGSVEAKCK
ncbi:hypothetical protein N7G274_009365 [Stereocaulon virgatum]|uniref:Uncharacterized protein n=1 Tax=Stereocaulon virgatum TaxID=373712 RepID=A0ABR3ZYM6_9LECA